MLELAEVPDQSEIQPKLAGATNHLRCSVEDLDSWGETASNLALNDKSGKPPVLVVGTGIDPVATAPIRGPRPKALLDPEWQECLQVSATEISCVRPGRNFQ